MSAKTAAKKKKDVPFILGLSFLEIAAPNGNLDKQLSGLGLSRTGVHHDKNIHLYVQNDMKILANYDTETYANLFKEFHGSPICGMGIKVKNPEKAVEQALMRGATRAKGPLVSSNGKEVPCVYGVAGSLVYFVDVKTGPESWGMDLFKNVKGTGEGIIQGLDHVMSTVPSGMLESWTSYYEKIFDFTREENNHYEIGKNKFNTSVLLSPCETFHIVLKEEEIREDMLKEYLATFKGTGIQHIGFKVHNLVDAVHYLQRQNINMVKANEKFYSENYKDLDESLPPISELKECGAIIHSEAQGTALHAFTEKIFDGVYLELIQYIKGRPIHNEKGLFLLAAGTSDNGEQ